MTFEELLDQAVAMLQRQGRVAYRALKRQFDLDDAAFDDLKEALLYAHPEVLDDEGRGLIWPREIAAPAAPASPSALPAPRSVLPEDPPRSAMRPGELSPSDAERRQLTVMFCDLVDSTSLAGHLDPEDYRDVVRAYLETCAEVIQRFDGHIAKYLGDGILVYFGYPHAHEDDAQRAVYAGLGMREAIAQMNERLARERGLCLAVRLGIHTGLVVAGELGGGATREPLAIVGETPNIAARLQAVAEPNTVVISITTYQLVQGFFVCQDLGTPPLKGVATPLQVYRVHGERAAESRFEAGRTTGLTPLIGRDEELGLILRRWAQARAGEGQVVLLTGEPGIGKSRLLEAVHERLTAEPHLQLLYQCSPYHTNSAFYPIIVQLARTAHFESGDPPAQQLDKLEALLAQATPRVGEVAPLVAALLALPADDRYPPLALSPARQKAQTIAALIDHITGLSRRQPVLCLVEDAHWCDPTTLEVLEQLVHRLPELRVLVIIASRPEFAVPWTAAHTTTLTLTRLGQAQIASMVAHLTAGKALPPEVLAQILDKTDGVPLFVEELTKTILESGLLCEGDGRYVLTGPLPPLAIPATVQDSLMARLDRLAPVKEVAQLGAALGREFAYAVLAAVSPRRKTALPEALEQLVGAGLLFRRGQPPEAHYRFKHALVQEAAYASLLKSTRQQLHTRIATVLEARFPAMAETEPEVVARHYMEAGCAEQAVVYWQRAGQHASDRSAHLEAVSHLTAGIELLTSLAETPARIQHALTLHIALGAALQMAKGGAAPEVEHAYTQAHALCQRVGETPELAPVLFGLWRFYVTRSQWYTARELGDTLLRLAQRTDDPALAVIAHWALGATWFGLGALPAARQHLEEGSARYTPDQRRAPVFRLGQDPGVACRALAAMTLWVLGYPAQALVDLHEALALAHELAHPFSLAWARCRAAFVLQFCRDVPATHEHAEAAVASATEQGFPLYAAYGTSCRGWALAMQGQDAAGLAQLRQGIAAVRATGAALFVPYLCAVLADAAAHLGHTEDGLQALAEAQTLVEQHEERWWEAEVHRLRGVLLLRQPGTPREEAETWLQRALDVACRQQAKSLELRAAMSLARLWQQQGRGTEARELLAPIYGWFTEGFDTADLQEAKALLTEVSR
jgi:class 3 adenylate cyclase/predicted ATPase